MKALSASRKRKRAAASCTEVNTVAGTLTALVIENPGSPQVLVYSAEITASSDLVCTDAEKVSLGEMNENFDRAVDRLLTAISAAEEQLAYFFGAEQPLRVAFIIFSRHTITPLFHLRLSLSSKILRK